MDGLHEMASNRTIETTAEFIQVGYNLNIFPFKVNWNPYITIKISFNTKYNVAACFAVTVNTAVVLAFMTDLILILESIDLYIYIYSIYIYIWNP